MDVGKRCGTDRDNGLIVVGYGESRFKARRLDDRRYSQDLRSKVAVVWESQNYSKIHHLENGTNERS